MKRITYLTLMLVMICGIAKAQWGQAPDPNAGLGIKDTYKDYFSIGVAVNQRNVVTPEQMALIQKEFNSITAENDMKPVSVHPKEGVWNWGGADSIANFCREKGIKLRLGYITNVLNTT